MNNKIVSILVISVLIVSALAYDRHVVENGRTSPVGAVLDFFGVAKFFSWHRGGKKVTQDKIKKELQALRDGQKENRSQRAQLTESVLMLLVKLGENSGQSKREAETMLQSFPDPATDTRARVLQELAKHERTLEREYAILGENITASENRLIDQWDRLDGQFASAIQLIEETTPQDLASLMATLNAMWNEQLTILENLQINRQRLQSSLLLHDGKAAECLLAAKAGAERAQTDFYEASTDLWEKRNALIRELEAQETDLILNLRSHWQVDWDFLMMVAGKVSLDSGEVINRCQASMSAIDQNLNDLLRVRKSDAEQYQNLQNTFFEALRR